MITAQRIDHLFICPKCANEGNKVKIITPQTLLKEGALERLKNKLAYKFCQKPDCDVVYFSKESGHVFLTSGLKLPATVKDPGLDIFVCYCFGHTRESVLDEIKKTGDSTVLQDIKAKMKDPGCFCERSNPQGDCCLGNVQDWVTSAKNQKLI